MNFERYKRLFEMAKTKLPHGFVVEIFGGTDTRGPGRKEHGEPHIVVTKGHKFSKLDLRTLEQYEKPKKQKHTEDLTQSDLKLLREILTQPSLDVPSISNWKHIGVIWRSLNSEVADKLDLNAIPNIDEFRE